ncbi:MAG: PASTA domain-containing protein [Ruminococcaceae bacterium]|nr:PASTA domain-containing protein [Oscillospiraceae bacterium]
MSNYRTPDEQKPASILGRQPSEMRLRALIVFSVCTVLTLVVIGRLFYLQIIRHTHYKKLVLEQMLYETEISASRGTITDRNGITLAANYTTERVFIDPSNIAKADDPEAVRVMIAEKLSEILEVEYDFVYGEAKKSKYRDRTIKKNVDKEITNQIRAFMVENKDMQLSEKDKDLTLSDMIYFSESTTRVYPFGTLASHVIGFCGSDGGLYGLEYQYNKALSGTSGKIMTAKDGNNGSMPYNYETYVDAENGANLVTTLDYKIQSYLEKYLEEAALESGCASRACGIIMNVKTGEIYAMATYPYYDLNKPRTLPSYYDEVLADYAEKYGADSTKYLAYQSELLFSTWNNKCLTDTYEPGSTSKIFTTSMALEENLASLSNTFTCTGGYLVSGWSKPIRCHKTTGHGILDFAGALQQSCNPAMMQLAERIGVTIYGEYFKAFGLDSKTGIDLPGEASSIYKPAENMSNVDLAVYSFGQRYNVTAIQQIAAVAAVANGGTMVVPHIVKEIVDDEGSVIASFGTTAVRQVISEETADTISKILADGVAGDGGAKNAYVQGYSVAAKTGTTEKGTSGNKRIASTVAYAPADDPEVICLLIVDEPTIGSRYGSTVAAPYVSKILADVLPYLGIEPEYTDEELAKLEINLPNYRGLSLDEAIMRLSEAGLSYEIVGTGNSIVDQIPPAKSTLSKDNGLVILYTSEAAEEKNATVPNVLGMSAAQANKVLANAGFNIHLEGALNGSGAVVMTQSLAAGTVAPKGTVITVDIRHTNFTD